MPLSLDFAQFLAEGNITDEDYNSLSITEKINALGVFRSCSSRQVPGNLCIYVDCIFPYLYLMYLRKFLF